MTSAGIEFEFTRKRLQNKTPHFPTVRKFVP